MEGGRSEICPVCGNTRIGGVCWRCRANESSRTRAWRRGDQGGVRPERRSSYNPPQSESKTTKRRPVKRRKRYRIPPEDPKRETAVPELVPKKSGQSSNPVEQMSHTSDAFYLSLPGEWVSDQENIRIRIDLLQNVWHFTLANSNQIQQKWKVISKSPNELRFGRDGKEIIARVDKRGRLLLTGKAKPVPFVYFKDGKRYRLCMLCHKKTEWQHERCQNCGRSF